MASNNKVAMVSVVFALLLVANCAEAYMCTRGNKYYHGPCVNNLNCASSCVHKKLGTGGHCARPKQLSAANADADIDWIVVRRKRICECYSPCPPSGGGEEPPSGGEQPAPPSVMLRTMEASN
ncbi:hypothetical protein BAE44_0017723 [Dichanthelium oligosanthes]|uniref:Knottins-like domain-containing protein n=1 Tax=Dichanthelium oligosanthes TaxID=888268 RepID=A0A1E5V814_9POAL|nr:hypothetical protein BAE44_0017723 [Dichanthelium oligosanthes]